MEIWKQSLTELKKHWDKGDLKSEEIVADCFAQVEKINPKVNAFVTMNDKALDEAKEMDQKKGSLKGRLAGIPLGIKDMLCTEGLKTTAASKILANFAPPYSSTVVERLKAEGGIVLGKCNQDEFAMGSSNELSHFGSCKNPWNLEYVPGGSSGGSAASVASGMVPGSIGTDTGGSIRQPASYCGIVGVKPTYGRVSRYGIVAFASSLDQAGPMARTVEDAALLTEVISGHDPKDGTTAQASVPQWSKNLKEDLSGIKIGLPKEFLDTELDDDVRKGIETAIDSVKNAGAEVVEVTLPLTEMSVPVYYLVATSEASSNLARYDGVRFGYRSDFSQQPAEDLADFYCRTRGEGFGPEVKRRIMLGTYSLSSGYYDAYYKKASQVRRLLRDQFLEVYKNVDALLSPVATTPAFKIGDRIDDPLKMYLNDVFTVSANLGGFPGMSVPTALSQKGLPVGVQILASHFEEQKMFQVGYAIEKSLGFNQRVPDVLR